METEILVSQVVPVPIRVAEFACFANLASRRAIIEQAEDNRGQDEIDWFTTMSHWNTIVCNLQW